MVVQAPELKPLRADIVGFAVAGGRSRRMGGDKALLTWEGTTLLDHALARLRAVCTDVRILCGPEARYEDRAPVVRDAAPDLGPLGGLAAGLRAAGGRAGLLLAVDVPYVPASVLHLLAELREGHDAVVPDSASGSEPLCAVYGPGCLEPIEQRLSAGERRMTSFWPDVTVRRVRLEELRQIGDPERLFLNVNTPEEYDRAQRR